MNDINEKTAADVRQIVLDIIAEIAPDADLSKLRGGASDAAQTPLRDLLGLDSMDFLDIVMELRKQHHIDVPEADYPRLNTLQSCVEHLLPKFNGK